jgi:diguanylate cyclase (GGDEF)-like protein
MTGMPTGKGVLGRRLTRLALAASALALLVAGSVLNVALFLIAKQGLVQETTAQAQVIAANISAALLFTDVQAAAETLNSLERSPGIARATLTDAHGTVVADYRRAADGAAPVGRERPGATLDARLLVFVQSVQVSGGEIGRLRFEVPLDPLYRRAVVFGAITLAAAALAMLLSYLLAVGVRRDVDRVERRLDELAYLDPVTGLFNRHAVREHLIDYIERAQGRHGFSVVTLDLDGFKVINDTLGHHVGDEVLREAARRLLATLHPEARAYRFGGDEFVLICPTLAGFREPQRFGHSVRTALGEPMRASGHEMVLSGSIGVARFPIDGQSADEVLLASDMAMNAAKAAGKNSFSVFDARLRDATQHRLRIETELRRALREGELRLFYQPVVEAVSGGVYGAEALVRWQHPQRGLLLPGEFIDVAETSGLIVPLGGWVLEEAARQVVRWQAAGFDALQLAVNVSARQLRGAQLGVQYRSAIAATGCPAERLEIEMTEHTLIEDLDENMRVLNDLRSLGAQIAIDDFGTGLSSLAYLKRLPLNKLKIDRSFVRDLPGDHADVAIVGAAISMAQALGLRVVGEGVETEAQLDTLRSLGCDLIQGYYYGRPMDAAQFETWLRERRVAHPGAAARPPRRAAGRDSKVMPIR